MITLIYPEGEKLTGSIVDGDGKIELISLGSQVELKGAKIVLVRDTGSK